MVAYPPNPASRVRVVAIEAAPLHDGRVLDPSGGELVGLVAGEAQRGGRRLEQRRGLPDVRIVAI